jgi:glucokinase
VANGSLQRGANGFAGEFGHMVVDPTGPPCPCGRRGCWERYASGSGLAMLAREAATGHRLHDVVRHAGGDAQAVRGEHVQAAAREGDPEALAVIDDFARWVALGLANLTNALDPEMFVLGGGLAPAPICTSTRSDAGSASCSTSRTCDRCRDRVRPLGPLAGAVGAALLPELAEHGATACQWGK